MCINSCPSLNRSVGDSLFLAISHIFTRVNRSVGDSLLALHICTCVLYVIILSFSKPNSHVITYKKFRPVIDVDVVASLVWAPCHQPAGNVWRFSASQIVKMFVVPTKLSSWLHYLNVCSTPNWHYQ